MPRKKKQKNRLIYFLLILLIIGGIPYLNEGSILKISTKEEFQTAKGVSNHTPSTLSQNLEIPSPLPDRQEQIITHDGYTVSYNANWRIPNWVAYELTENKTQGTVKRGNDFIPDPQVKGHTATTEDYKHSGYDRGHMAPAADMKWSTYAMAQCFYLSNICPQNSNLNKGDWKELEEKGRIWAQQYGSIYIVCGPIVEKTYTTIGKNKVAIPHSFFKVFLRNSGNPPEAIGFIFPNKAGNQPLRTYSTSIDEIEQISGIDFFPALPDSIENRIEAKYNPEKWEL